MGSYSLKFTTICWLKYEIELNSLVQNVLTQLTIV